MGGSCVFFHPRGFGSGLGSLEGTQSPHTTSGPDEPEFDGVFNAHGLLFATQTNEADTVVDTLSAVTVANVQGHGVPFHIEKQPVRTAVSNLVPELEQTAAYPLVTCRTRCSAQPILLNLGVV